MRSTPSAALRIARLASRINDENKAEKIAVELGDSAGDMIAVSGALAEGDRVAIRGAENQTEGADVKIMVSQKTSSSSNAVAAEG